MGWLAIIDRFIPPVTARDEEQLRAARLVVATALGLALMAFALAGSRVVLHGLGGAAGQVLLVVACGFAIVPWIRPLVATPAHAGAALAVIGLAGVTGMALTDGGLYSEALFWAPFVPLAAILMAPPRLGVAVALLASTMPFGLLALHFVGAEPELPPVSNDTLVLRSAGCASATAFAGVLAWFYDRTRARAQARLWRLANFDQLTGLPNRELFLAELARALARTERHPDRRAGLLLIDLDGFKEVNDTLGHAAGDAVLKVIGQRLAVATRASELPCRLSGDEFTVILDLEGDADAVAAAERVRALIAEPVGVADTEVAVTSSVGVASSRPGDDPDALLLRADRAMYKSKRRGRNRIQVSSARSTA